MAPADGTVCSQDFTPFLVAAGPAVADAEAEAVTRSKLRSDVMAEVALRPGR